MSSRCSSFYHKHCTEKANYCINSWQLLPSCFSFHQEQSSCNHVTYSKIMCEFSLICKFNNKNIRNYMFNLTKFYQQVYALFSKKGPHYVVKVFKLYSASPRHRSHLRNHRNYVNAVSCYTKQPVSCSPIGIENRYPSVSEVKIKTSLHVARLKNW